MLEFGKGELKGISLTDSKTHSDRDLREVWRYIRKTRPVLWHPGIHEGFWVVSNYHIAKRIYGDKVNFSSKNGNSLDSLLAGGDPAGGKMLSLSDGPHHMAIRSRTLKHLRRLVICRIEERIKISVRIRMANVMDLNCDLVEDFAKHIPLDSICELMGIEDQAKRDTLYSLASNALSSINSEITAEQSVINRSEMLMLLAEIIESKRRHLGDDLISDLIRMKDTAVNITDEEILYNSYMLFLGGNEEPRFAIAGMLKALAQNPEEWHRLKKGQVTLANAVDEVFRWTTPVLHLARTVIKDIQIEGIEFKAGQIVSIWNSSANFDETVFEDPYRLNLGRKHNPHLSLGYGNHYCLGANLAKLELSEVISTLVDKVDCIQITAPSKPVYSNFIFGLANLPGCLKSIRTGKPGIPSKPAIAFEEVSSEFFNPEFENLFCITPKEVDFNALNWLQSQQESLEQILSHYGGFLLRNFGVNSVSEFNKIALTLAPSLLDYVNRSTPRTKLGGKIYTSTEYPNDKHIILHNENSYTPIWPSKIMFYCAIAPSQGGETIVADSRLVYDEIDPQIRKRFEKDGVLYIRNYTPGVDLSWQEVFQTDDKLAVNAFCKEHGIQAEWREGRTVLTTRQKSQATHKHPTTGKPVWFNQAHLFHFSALDEVYQKVLIDELGIENIPRNSFYGSGEPIEAAVLSHIKEIYDRHTITFQWQRGDLLVLDNMLFAHGRNPYQGNRKVVVAMA